MRALQNYMCAREGGGGYGGGCGGGCGGNVLMGRGLW